MVNKNLRIENRIEEMKSDTKNEKSQTSERFGITMVPKAGIEPARSEELWILRCKDMRAVNVF